MLPKLYSKIVLVTILCCLSCVYANAQFRLTGKVFGSGETKMPLAHVAVMNKTANDMTYSDDNGAYTITVYAGDTLEFDQLGYFSYKYFVGKITGPLSKNIILSQKKNVIEGVIVDGRTQYQRDSLAREKRYDKALGYEQTATIMSPVTSLYQQFSKKYKDLRKFQHQYADMEQQKFIDTKYTYDVVTEITKLTGDSAAYFMNTYPMEYNFARTSGALEIKLWIKHNFKEYISKPISSTAIQSDSLQLEKK